MLGEMSGGVCIGVSIQKLAVGRGSCSLTKPERATYETLQNALERWEALKLRCDKKKDQFGAREPLPLPESLAVNAMDRLVPKELEQHLLLNFARFKTFEEMEKEAVNFMEAKTGTRMVVSTNFFKFWCNSH